MFKKKPKADAGPPPIDETARPPHPIFYMYFSDEATARNAADVLRDAGWAVRVSDTAAPEWGVIATGTPATDDIATAEDKYFIPFAESRGGEFDGNEIPIG